MNNPAMAFTLLVLGLVTFASAVMGTTGAMLSGLFYGAAGLSPAASTITPTTTVAKDGPIPGLVVPAGVTVQSSPYVHNSVNPGMHNPTVKP